MNKHRGSLTVEATLSMIIFLSVMLLFLLFTKMTLIEYSLQNIAAETAQRISDTGYIFQIIENQLNYAEPEDEGDKDNRYGKSVAQILIKDIGGGALSIFTGNLLTGDDAKKMANIKGGAVSMGVDTIFSVGSLVLKNEAVEAAYFNKKRITQDNIVKSAIQGSCALNDFVDSEKIVCVYVKFPESSKMFEQRKLANVDLYTSIGVSPATYLEKEDVMVVLSYPFEFNLPFLGKQKYVVTKTAIEHAWLYGGNGIQPSSEGVLSKLINEVANILLYGFDNVKITNNGRDYHRNSCSNLVGEYAFEMRKYSAIKKGYKACAVCVP